MWAGRKKNFREGGIGLGAKKYFERGNRAGRKKTFREGGIGQGGNFSDHNFLKFYGGGNAWGTKKKSGGGCG